MILLMLQEVPHEQDVRELFMAFYPEQEYAYTENTEADIVFQAVHRAGQYLCSLRFMKEEQSFSFAVEAGENRAQNKNALKKQVYKILEARTGRSLPWGTLTGIRPSKLVMEMLEAGLSTEAIALNMREAYFISEEKLELCMQTARTEKRILDKMDYREGFSLYIGIPFCPSTCAYCSFTSYPIGRWKKQVQAYIAALCWELAETARLMRGKKLQSIYMGGGTPSSLEAKDLDRILACVAQHFDLEHLLEYSVEAGRPDSITEEKLKVLQKYGVSRISINPQTMKEETLRLIGRGQTTKQFLEAYAAARELGFDNINTDIILGLPEESLQDVEHTMAVLKELAPESVTVHSLAIKRAAKLRTHKESYLGLKIENNSRMIESSARVCREMGLAPYYLYRQKNMIGNFENVGYAKPGKECIYNILIMEEKQSILACGAGTSTKLVFGEENRLERIENVKDPQLYIDRLEELLERKRKLLKQERL